MCLAPHENKQMFYLGALVFPRNMSASSALRACRRDDYLSAAEAHNSGLIHSARVSNGRRDCHRQRRYFWRERSRCARLFFLLAAPSSLPPPLKPTFLVIDAFGDDGDEIGIDVFVQNTSIAKDDTSGVNSI